ncbi:MAG: Ig-like domain-containing protein [Acidobacteriota bacterium]|nr:Ig-like domain-containing protein [Acidobacteriota bacterium]
MKYRHSLIVLLAVWSVSCGPGNPDAPRLPTTPGAQSPAGIQRIELVAPASIAPGQSVQLTANAVRFDNSVENVSGQAQWRSSDSRVVEISSTGLAKAIARGEAFLSVFYQSRSASTSTFVLPSGTYRLRGTVTDNGLGLPGVTVSVIEGVGVDLTVTTDEKGEYALYGVRDRIRLQAQGAGCISAKPEIYVADHRTLDFEMRPGRERTDLHGSYSLTFKGNLCPKATMTETTRSYEATVGQDGAHLTVALSGADFVVSAGRGNAFSGVIDAGDQVTFGIGQPDVYYYEYRAHELMERLDAGRILIITGRVTARPSPSGLSGTLKGAFLVLRQQPQRIGTSLLRNAPVRHGTAVASHCNGRVFHRPTVVQPIFNPLPLVSGRPMGAPSTHELPSLRHPPPCGVERLVRSGQPGCASASHHSRAAVPSWHSAGRTGCPGLDCTWAISAADGKRGQVRQFGRERQRTGAMAVFRLQGPPDRFHRLGDGDSAWGSIHQRVLPVAIRID